MSIDNPLTVSPDLEASRPPAVRPGPADATALPSRADVSVAVISKDEPDLDRTLHLLADQLAELAAVGLVGEVVVVDASSGRMDYLADAHPWVRWYAFTPRLDQPTSIPAQRNESVAYCSAPVIAFADCGSEPQPGWLLALTAPLRDGRAQFTAGPVVPLGSSVYATINDVPDGGVVDSPPTCNVAFTRAAFDAVGGFDTRFAYGSDVDFAWRLRDRASIPCISAVDACMAMPWGGGKRQLKRSWQYARARGRLLWLHPSRRAGVLAREPELVAYPAWILAAGAATAVSLARRSPLPVALVASALAVPAFRARHSSSPLQTVAGKLVSGAGLLTELAAGHPDRRPRSAPVLLSPRDPSPYQHDLVAALDEQQSHAADFLARPTGSHTVNLALLPGTLARARWHGARIWHVHWMHDFAVPFTDAAAARRLSRAWLSVSLASAHVLGLKVVWTAHNFLPHEQIFDDDRAARRALTSRCDAIVALDDSAADRVHSAFAGPQPVVIAQGIHQPPSVDRVAARAALGLAADDLVLVHAGLVRFYKGTDLLLEEFTRYAKAHPSTRLRLLVAGQPDAHMAPLLAALTRAADPSLVRVVPERVSDEVLDQLTAAADAAILPFRTVTNSSSVLHCLARSRPALVPALPALAGLPATLAFTPPGERLPDEVLRSGLADLFASLDAGLDLPVVDAGGLLAERSWSQVAAAHLELYRSVL